MKNKTLAEASFPLRPALRGRAHELRVLKGLLRAQGPCVVALVGAGGSGKSTLACALGHELRREFQGRLLWLRIGAWDRATVLELLALQLGLGSGGSPLEKVRAALSVGPTYAVLDNHEDDRATAEVLWALSGLPTTFVLTARRCLLGGVTVFPVVPALVERRTPPYPGLGRLTELLRWHPVALALADALLRARVHTVASLDGALRERGVLRIQPLAHEDDVPEVGGVVREALGAVSPTAKRLLAVLAHTRGDHVDAASLLAVAKAGRRGAEALERLRALRLVQEPQPGCYALHATVRFVLSRELAFDEGALAGHYLELFEREPERVQGLHTQLFALMDWAQEKGELELILRVGRLARALGAHGE